MVYSAGCRDLRSRHGLTKILFFQLVHLNCHEVRTFGGLNSLFRRSIKKRALKVNSIALELHRGSRGINSRQTVALKISERIGHFVRSVLVHCDSNFPKTNCP